MSLGAPAFGFLHFRENGFLDLLDFGFVALIEGPLLDSPGTGQSGLAQDFHMLTRGWLTHTKLACDRTAADPVLH